MRRCLLHSLVWFRLATCLPQQTTPIDPGNPNGVDPVSVPDNDFALPELDSVDLFPNGFPVLPEQCDSANLTEDCFRALDESGAKFQRDNDWGCSDDQDKLLRRGFQEARDILKYAAKWSSDRSSRDIVSADYWIGEDWRDFAGRISGNLGRASDFINNKDNSRSYITFTCRDPKGYCKRGDIENKRIGGYAWDVKGWFGYVYGYINMCDPYFSLTSLSSKIDELNGYRKNKEIGKIQDMRYYQTYGQFMAHEMMHLRSTYDSEPKIVDEALPMSPNYRAYGPKKVHQLAQGDASGAESGGKVSTTNADSYAMLVNSVFWWDVTQYFPGVPGKKEGPGPPGLPPALVVFPFISLENITDLSAQSIDDQLLQAIDSYLADEGSDQDTGTANIEPPQPPPPPPPSPDQNTCHGISGDFWVMSRDVAVDNARDFCNQADLTKKYNEGSVNELELSVRNVNNNTNDLGAKDSPECIGRFQNAVIDGCDGNDPVNNPHNYKFGSTLRTGDGWEYKMTPFSKQVNQVNCDVGYKFFFDSFEIRGKNLPDAKLGANGEGLHSQLSGCGALKKWKFETTPNDCCFQWHASGRLPIGTKACVGRALESAGGSSKGNCHGAGKRELIASNSIDYWPGYGDDGKHIFRDDQEARRDSIDSWPGYGDEGRHVFGNSTREA